METFAEVILPLPLNSTFTYGIPPDLIGTIEVGSRVFVQFGRKKYYTGIVESLHHDKPSYEVKPIMMHLDPAPVVRYPQLKFWKWVADYYLCSLGEVYKAAVPSGLKIESETLISLNPDYESDGSKSLSEKEALIIQALTAKPKLKVSEIEEDTGIKNAGNLINVMLREGILEVSERIIERYRPKKETMVRITLTRNDHDGLHAAMDSLSRTRKGERMLLAYLDKSGWLNRSKPLREVSKKELLETSGCTPGVLKTLVDKGILEIYKKEINRFRNADVANTAMSLAKLSHEQSAAKAKITSLFRDMSTVVLRGVTGSGKTEIYTHLIADVLKEGSQVLYLVPEISLTTQLTDRLRSVFGDSLVVYHSKFSDSERVDIYKKIRTSTDPMVILGVRSSVFLPFARLGLVIVDEEHESSFKQYDPAPRYNARDAAIVLASMHGAKTLLGSGTPSVETYYKALTGKFGLVELLERYNKSTMPDVEIVDMREQRRRKANRRILSEPLRSATFAALADKRQAIMFQNRRGFAPIVVCSQCGWTPKCSNCDVSLVYHKSTNRLSCHYCGFTAELPSLCPACGLNGIETYGYGTERIAEEMHEQFDGFRVARMDLDTTRNKNSYQEIIEDFARHDTDILVGTQMISKGLDFGKVNVVGVLNADTLLNFPDFRSDERAFNMLEQVAGRAGRREEKGKVIIQTSDPENDVLKFVETHDFEGFYNREISQRQKFDYPPFTRVIIVYIKNRDKAITDAMAEAYAGALRKIFGNRVLGPQRPVVGRIANFYLQTIMLKIETGASMPKVKHILRQVYETMASDSRMRSTTVYYDVDPV